MHDTEKNEESETYLGRKEVELASKSNIYNKGYLGLWGVDTSTREVHSGGHGQRGTKGELQGERSGLNCVLPKICWCPTSTT